jgi:hypothetical protein
VRLRQDLSLWVIWWLVLSLACDRQEGDKPPEPSAKPAASEDEEVITVDDEPVDDGADEQDHEASCAPADPSLKALQLLRMTLAGAIEGKDPKDRLEAARPGQRVYAHLRMRNRSGRDRCVRVRFRVKGEERTLVTLKVGHSWSWRTWAYATLRDDDRGRLDIEVVDDQGATIATKALGIVPPN